jgi:predicted patatin/cPLA2 family phospholipase
MAIMSKGSTMRAGSGQRTNIDDLWRPDHPVLEILRQRRQSGSRPGGRTPDDTAKVGLAVEGGGMRGVVSAAMLQVIEESGLHLAFDAVYGCSSGAINAAYYLAGDTWYPVSIYFHDLTTRKFIDFWRGVRGGNILNLEYPFEVVLAQRKSLDYQRVLESPVPLKIAVTDVEGLETILAFDYADMADLKAALLSSSWLPIAVRGTAEFRGRRAVDGGVLTALPFRLALQDGCTHILSLSTRPMRPPSSGLSLMHRYTCLYLERIHRGLGKGYLEAIRQKRRDQAMLLDQRHLKRAEAPYILDLAPLSGTKEIKRHELRLGPLVDAATSAAEVMYCAVERRPVSNIQSGEIRAIPRITIVDKSRGNVRVA